MATSGFKFKVMKPNDIASVLATIDSFNAEAGAQAGPSITADAIDKPNSETAGVAFQKLAEYCYDAELSQVKMQIVSQLPGWTAYPDIYEDALDGLIVHRLCRRLVNLNSVDDFTYKDIWDPNSKRFRAVVSAIINYCRYKESRVAIFQDNKEELQAWVNERDVLQTQSTHLSEELANMEGTCNQTQLHMEEIKKEVVDLQVEHHNLVDANCAEGRVLKDKELSLQAVTERCENLKDQITICLDECGEMQSRIADSPEGIEDDIAQLKASIDSMKARLAEKAEEKRDCVYREQTLRKRERECQDYLLVLDNLKRASEQATTAHANVARDNDDAAALRRQLDAITNENTELELTAKQIGDEMANTAKEHDRKLQELDTRTRGANEELTRLQAKRTDEQKKAHEVQAKRNELDAELENEQRQQEATINNLKAQIAVAIQRRENYDNDIELLLSQHQGRAPYPDAEYGGSTTSAVPTPLGTQQVHVAGIRPKRIA